MKLQSKILSYLKRRKDVWCIKVEMANERGCPDILLGYAGRFVAIEVKDNNDIPTVLQYETLCDIVQTGNIAWIVALKSNVGRIERLLRSEKYQVARKRQAFNTCTMINVIDYDKWLNKFKERFGE